MPGSPLVTKQIEREAIHGIVGVAGLALVCNIGALAVPLFSTQVFNRVLPTRELHTLAALGIGLLICLITWAMLDVLRSVALDALAARLARSLSVRVVHAIASSPRADFTAAETLSDMESLRSFISSHASLAPFDIAWTPVLLLVLFILHWGYAVLAVLCIAILAGMNLLGDALSRRAMLAANTASATALRRAGDAVTAAEAVLPLGMLPTLSRLWTQAQAEASALVHRATLRARTISAATGTLRFAMTGAMVALGLILALNDLASSGSMVAANMILTRILLPFHSVAATRRQWVDALASWRRLEAALGSPVPHRYQDAMPDPEPRLVVDNLSYIPPGDDRPLHAKHQLHRAARRGDRHHRPLLLRQEHPAPAHPRHHPPDRRRRLPRRHQHLSLGTQKTSPAMSAMSRSVPALLDESAAENIARMQHPDLRAVIAAAKRAGIHRTIATLPHGYATCLSATSSPAASASASPSPAPSTPARACCTRRAQRVSRPGRRGGCHRPARATPGRGCHSPRGEPPPLAADLRRQDPRAAGWRGRAVRAPLGDPPDRAETVRPPDHTSGKPVTARQQIGRVALAGLALALLLTVFLDIAILVVPIYDMQLYDRVLMSRNMDTLTMLSVACCIGLLLYFLVESLRSACFVAIGQIIARRLNGPVLEESIRRAASGDAQAGPQLARDVNELQSFVASGAIAVPFDALCAPLFLVVLFLLHPAFGFLAIAGIAALVFANAVLEFLASPALLRAQARRRTADELLSRSLAEPELIAGLGMLPAIGQRWAARRGDALAELNRAASHQHALTGLSRLARLILQGGVMALGSVLIIGGATTPGSLMGANLLLNKLIGPFAHLVGSWKHWVTAYAAWQRVHQGLANKLPAPSGATAPGVPGDGSARPCHLRRRAAPAGWADAPARHRPPARAGNAGRAHRPERRRQVVAAPAARRRAGPYQRRRPARRRPGPGRPRNRLPPPGRASP